jgi:hypothetical protein
MTMTAMTMTPHQSAGRFAHESFAISIPLSAFQHVSFSAFQKWSCGLVVPLWPFAISGLGQLP